MHPFLKGCIVICSFTIYLAIGAAIFEALERPAEADRAKVADELKSQFVADFTRTYNITESALANITDILNRYYKAESDYQAAIQNNWFYGAAFFFCVTVVTTIGYGNISPSTSGGQTFCVLYALIGIPFAAYLLSMIGGFYGNMYNYLETRLNSRLDIRKRSERWRKAAKWSFIVTIAIACYLLFFVIPAAIFTAVETWSYRQAVYYAFITLSTIGFGDFVAGQDVEDKVYRGLYKVAVGFWIILGLSFLALIITRMTSAVESVVEGQKSEEEGEKKDKSGETLQLKREEDEGGVEERQSKSDDESMDV